MSKKDHQRTEFEFSKSRLKASLPADQASALGDQIKQLCSPLVEGAGLIGDYIRVFRQAAAIRGLSRVRQLARQHKIPLEPVPPKFFIQWLEAVSLEDDDSDLFDMWSHLLLDASLRPNACKPIFIDILKKIGSEEAKILDEIWSLRNRKPIFHYSTSGSYVEDLQKRIRQICPPNMSRNHAGWNAFWRRLPKKIDEHLKYITTRGLFLIRVDFPRLAEGGNIATGSAGGSQAPIPFSTLTALQVLLEDEYFYNFDLADFSVPLICVRFHRLTDLGFEFSRACHTKRGTEKDAIWF